MEVHRLGEQYLKEDGLQWVGVPQFWLQHFREISKLFMYRAWNGKIKTL